MVNKKSKRIERFEAERKRYDGRTQKEIREELLAGNEVIFGGVIGRGIVDLYESIKNDNGVLTYLAEIHSKRTGTMERTILEHGVDSVREVARSLLLNCGKLPSEVYDGDCRRRRSKSDGDYSGSTEVAYLLGSN